MDGPVIAIGPSALAITSPAIDTHVLGIVVTFEKLGPLQIMFRSEDIFERAGKDQSFFHVGSSTHCDVAHGRA